ncbi:MAG: hypothetical protein PHR06_16310 [Candidatus Cloacimonetes bacterium]|nr:hypothetical protein [Candidatus Cloacimonadota bacterium]
MNKPTKTRILKKLERAKVLADEAFILLEDDDREKCDRFAGLICDVDEAIGEVNKL